MCHYITLVASGADASRLDSFMKQYGRQACPTTNPSIARILRPGEGQYLTTVGHCDCGTALVPHRETPDAAKAQREKDIARLRKRGWSHSKIERWLADRTKVDSRPHRECIDTIDFWEDLISELLAGEQLSSAGLLVHFYSGHVDTEEFDPTRRDIDFSKTLADQLGTMQQDELLSVRKK